MINVLIHKAQDILIRWFEQRTIQSGFSWDIEYHRGSPMKTLGKQSKDKPSLVCTL